MTDRITDLLTEDGQRIAVGKRTGAIISELVAMQETIEKPQKGRVEITVDFKNSSVTVAVRDVREPRKIE